MWKSQSVFWRVGILFFGVGAVFGAARGAPAKKEYRPLGLCDGLPRIDVSTAPGFCVGIVDQGNGLIMPRGVLSLDRDNLLLADMGGWVKDRGKVYRLRRDASTGRYSRELVLDKLDRPHGLALGPDGKVYVGEAGALLRFDPSAPMPSKTVEVVLDQLPDEGRHPLKSFVFDQAGHLYLNIGSATDNCERSDGSKPDGNAPCSESDGAQPEARRGVVRRYRIDSKGNVDPRFEVFASGLRNSVALAIHPRTGEVFQGENSRDSINKRDPRINDATNPPEELNLLEAGQHYGWPYCYGAGSNSPEYPKAKCSRFRAPMMLWPAHAAPLSMFFYQGSMLPSDYQERLIVAYHGYRAGGHRIVAYPSDSNHRPSGEPINLVHGWDESGTRPSGAPVSLSEAADGSIYLTEDRNKTVLRIYYDPSSADQQTSVSNPPQEGPKEEDEEQDRQRRKSALQARLKRPESKIPSFSLFQSKVIDRSCVACHDGPDAPGVRLREFDDVGNARLLIEARDGQLPLVVPRDPEHSELLKRLSGDPSVPVMPQGGFATSTQKEEAVRLLRKWIDRGTPIPK